VLISSVVLMSRVSAANVDVDLELISLLERRELFMSSIPEDMFLQTYEPTTDRRGFWSTRVDYKLKFRRPLPDGRWAHFMLRVSTRIARTPTGRWRYSTFRRGRRIDDTLTTRMVGTSAFDRAQFISEHKENQPIFID